MSIALSIVVPEALLLVLVGVAAVIDLRTGKIPNWLTLPALLLGPVYWYLIDGPYGLANSLGGIFLCGLAPFLGYRAGGMPGGDLKLFLAVGGIVGPISGIEVQFFAMLAAGLFGIGVLIHRGRLREYAGNALARLRNRVVPEKQRREVPPIDPISIRIGPFVAVGAAFVVAEHHWLWREVLFG